MRERRAGHLVADRNNDRAHGVSGHARDEEHAVDRLDDVPCDRDAAEGRVGAGAREVDRSGTNPAVLEAVVSDVQIPDLEIVGR